MDADVIVVGAGHNGLICAAYLARAGIDTLLVEARSSVGGCASTVTDLDARFNICNCDHTMVRGMPVADELDLASYGLHYLESEIGGINRFYDGAPPWVFLHDIDSHIDALRETYPSQVAGYRRYLADALPV
ncbi:MAG: FAD-dependent oxidoreductase, partial [Ilumatobacter sp.]